MVADCRAAGDADTFLRDYCGIILDNADTGAITGWDAGGLSIKTAHGVIGETLSSLQHVPDYTDTTFKTSQGVTINISSTGDSLAADGKKVLDGLYSWWADESLKLIEESYGVKFTDNHKINFSLVPSASYWGQTGGTDVRINMGSTWFNNDDDYNGNGVDRTIVHEFTHVAQNLFMGRFPQFLHEGLADLTGGTDDRKSSRYLAGNADTLAEYLDINKGETGESNYYIAGFMFYRYLAKQASDFYERLMSYAWEEGSSIVGTDDAEFLTGSGKGVTISAGKGNDTITAYGENMNVFGDDGDDTIGNKGAKATISGGSGNDSIHNWSSNVLITGGSGNDVIYTTGENVTLKGGAGNRSMQVTIEAGTGNDYIYNSGDSVTIDAGDGKDSIRNSGGSVTITAGAGNDSISNYGASVSIDAGAGNDFLINGGYWEDERGGANVSIIGGKGNDTITSHGSKSVLDGGSGNDLIYNGYRYYQPWDAFYDSDSDEYNGNNSTIVGGVGNDSINNRGSNVKFKYTVGDGNDLIQGFNETSTLQIGDGKGSYSTKANGSDIIVTVGKGKITLIGAANLESLNINGVSTTLTLTDKMKSSVAIDSAIKIVDASARTKPVKITGNRLNNTITGGAGADTLSGGTGDDKILGGAGNDSIAGGDGKDTLSGGTGDDKILGGAGNDSIAGGDGKDTLSGGAGNDSIAGGDGKDTLSGGTGDDKILGGAGNDSIAGGDSKDTLSGGTGDDKILGGAGNDSIAGGDGKDTLSGGAGNDSLWGDAGADKFIYAKGDGKDIIYGFDSKDTLTLDGLDFTTSYSKSKGTITLKVNGGSIMLKDFIASTFHINNDTYQISGSKLVKK